MKKTVLILVTSLLLFSCNQQKSPDQKYLPDSVGAINGLSVIIDKTLWEEAVGDTIRRHYASPVPGLPWDEPLFTMHQLDEAVFTGFARNTRSVMVVKKGEKSGVTIIEDQYARPQKVIHVVGKTEEELMQLISKSSDSIIPMLKVHELKENQRRFDYSISRDKTLEEHFGISLKMSSLYKTVKKEDNFIWIERDIRKGTMNVIAYEMPMDFIEKDSSRVEAIFKMRDAIGATYIPGPYPETTYMITERAYSPFVFDVELAGKEAIQVKGMWEVSGYPMAGPFINYIIKDAKNNRLMVIEGFTFAPQTDKRNFMFELDAILQSVKFI